MGVKGRESTTKCETQSEREKERPPLKWNTGKVRVRQTDAARELIGVLVDQRSHARDQELEKGGERDWPRVPPLSPLSVMKNVT